MRVLQSDHWVQTVATQTAAWSGAADLDPSSDSVKIFTNKNPYIPQARRYVSSDWLTNLQGLPSSIVLKRIRGPVLSITVFTAFLVGAFELFHDPVTRFLINTISAHTLSGSALGLLLVFRTNTAYQRFWEGRTIWNRVLDLSRDLARGIALYSGMMDKRRLRLSIALLKGFPIALQEHLRGRSSKYMRKRLEELLMDPELYEDTGGTGLEETTLLSRLASWRSNDEGSGGGSAPAGGAPRLEEILPLVSNRPLFLVNRLGAELHAIEDDKWGGKFSSKERIWLLDKVNSLSAAIGACERIVQTPVPLSYVRHTSRFLSLWSVTLPLALVSLFGVFTIPAVAIITWALFGIMEIGLMIEDPFQGMLRLDVICQTIEADVDITLESIAPLPVDRRAKEDEASAVAAETPAEEESKKIKKIKKMPAPPKLEPDLRDDDNKNEEYEESDSDSDGEEGKEEEQAEEEEWDEEDGAAREPAAVAKSGEAGEASTAAYFEGEESTLSESAKRAVEKATRGKTKRSKDVSSPRESQDMSTPLDDGLLGPEAAAEYVAAAEGNGTVAEANAKGAPKPTDRAWVPAAAANAMDWGP